MYSTFAPASNSRTAATGFPALLSCERISPLSFARPFSWPLGWVKIVKKKKRTWLGSGRVLFLPTQARDAAALATVWLKYHQASPCWPVVRIKGWVGSKLGFRFGGAKRDGVRIEVFYMLRSVGGGFGFSTSTRGEGPIDRGSRVVNVNVNAAGWPAGCRGE